MLKYKDIKKQAYEGDTNCCTVISASLIFNKDYEDTRLYFAQNGRKTGKGVSWAKYEKIMANLAKLEGYKLTKYKITPWDIEGGRTTWAFMIEDDKKVDTLLKDLKTKTSVTVNNFRQFLPKGDYIFGMSGHVATVINGVVQDWTEGRAKRLCYIWTVEKTQKKVKSLNSWDSGFDLSKY